ncbi:MAG TPA: endolytic transglycosylase MltG [Gammaproteobacteria bacterium]|nr:endolytic transglycosylase MltG [Gammaproteobacteria bacterium]
MRKALGVAAVCCALFLAAGGAGLYAVLRSVEAPLAVSEPSALFEVPSGTSLREVAQMLAKRRIFAHPRLFVVYARLKGDATRIHAGEYELDAGLNARGLLEKLVAGQVYLHHFTVIEGWRFEDLLRALRADPAIASTGLDGKGIMTRLGQPNLEPEGEFFPDTYKFPRGTTDVEFLSRAFDAMQRHLAAAWQARDADLSLKSPYDALILASIIEKETALANERRKISGVFNGRLKRGMRLQTDPTVIYGLGDGFDGDLRTRDLQKDTPYNTYTHAGLPPTPIALPSEASLAAAVHPDDTDGALYFVATGLPDGSHYFSKTLAEHDAAVRRYLERTSNR